MTVDELVDAVDRDEKSHLIKDLAELLLVAMNDWPSFDETEIENFVKELKLFFGTPLTIETINSKPLNMGVQHFAWRYEAGWSIAELISRSTRIGNESDFDKILDQILNYYNPTRHDSLKKYVEELWQRIVASKKLDLVCPASELKTTRWIKENSVVCELTSYDINKITKDKFYGSALHLYQVKDALEKQLSNRTNKLFDSGHPF